MDQSAQQALQPVRVLIVEDNAADVVLVSRLLGRCTLFKPVVSVAENLNNALRHLATQPYDIVLLDLNLPDSSDLETLAQVLNQSSELPTPPVVVLTGHGDRET